jgi:formylglycine-generating enzyme required for sulfatase activity
MTKKNLLITFISLALFSQATVIGKNDDEMVLVPAGEFLMGADDGNKDGKPVHKVYLDEYYIDKYEVTNEQYVKFLNEYGKDIDDNGNKMIYEHDYGVNKTGDTWQAATVYEKHPVINVTWYGANQYAKHFGKRLPTEAEWEKACRAGSTTTYCFGDTESDLKKYAWYSVFLDPKTRPIGKKEPNVWEIYDMHGNVCEWCADWYNEKYYRNIGRRSSSVTNNPKGPKSGTSRVIRGGGWNSRYDRCWSACRDKGDPISGSNSGGFRCVRSAK